MSTPKKENEKTSDPVLQSSGEVLKEVREVVKEPSLQDVLNVINDKFGQMNAQLTEVKTDVADMKTTVNDLVVRMAIQEERVTPPRSRAPSREIFKELKTGVKVLEVSERSSLLEDFGSLEDSTSEDSAGVNLPVKTPMPGGPQFFARSLEADTRAGKTKEFVPKQMFKVAQPISEMLKPDEDAGAKLQAKEQVFTRFLKDHPAEPKPKADTGWLQMGSDTPCIR